MRALNLETSKIIDLTMDLLDTETLCNSGNYTFKVFSAFDHFLTDAEAEDKIMFYQANSEERNESKILEYFKSHDKLLNFYLDLYELTPVYGVLSQEYSGNRIKVEFDNIEEYKSHVLLSIREQLFLKIVIPEFFSVIMGNYDFNHLLYTLKSKPETSQAISSIIISKGLFILENNNNIPPELPKY